MKKILIRTISNIIGSWEHSNDLRSPTILSDAREEIRRVYPDIDSLTEDIIMDRLENILHFFRYNM